MMNPRYRVFWSAAMALVMIWIVAVGGFLWARASKPTADRVSQYARSIRLADLTGDARATALARLVDLLNGLPLEERRKARMERLWQSWFEQMTDDERVQFVEATAPSGFQQMLTSFENLPEERRRTAIADAMRRLKESVAGPQDEAGFGVETRTNSPPWVVSEELRDRVTRIGLKAYYSQSSARTKAEMAPLMEELQGMMEGGRIRRGPPRPSPSTP